MVQIVPANNRQKPLTFMQSIMGNLDENIPGAIEKYSGLKKEQQQKQAISDILGPESRNLTPEFQKLAYEAKLKSGETANKLMSNKAVLADLEEKRGLAPGTLDAYAQDPKMAEQVSRPAKPEKKTQASQPIDPDQLNIIKEVRNNPEYHNASPLRKYQIMTDAGVSKENAKAESDIAAAQIKPTQFEDEASKIAAKSAGEYRDKVVREYEGAISSNMRINKMMKLSKSGTLSTPLMVKSLNFVGLPLSILNNPNTEDYAKVENDYVRDVTSIFPGVIKNFEIESYMKTIPGLLNSDEGKQIVGENVRLINEGKILRYNALEKLIKENKGVTPRNSDMIVNERVRDQMDEISQKYLDNVHNALEKNGPKISMRDQEGNFYDVPTFELEKAMKEGLMISNE